MTRDDLLVEGPARGARTLLLAHGAGAPMDSPFMNEIAAGVAACRVRVVRFEFPHMAVRRSTGRRAGPDRQPRLLESWREAFRLTARRTPPTIGGKSMGGRMASMIADEVGARGLVCLGYPFHPPGKPERTRTAHLAGVRTPTLIIQGERDPLGTPHEVERYELSPAISIEWLPDGDHSFKPRVKSGHSLESNLERAVAAIASFGRGRAVR